MIITHSDFKKLSDQEQKEMINNSILNVLKFTNKLEIILNKYYEKNDGLQIFDIFSFTNAINNENRNVVRLVRFYQLIQNNKKK
jgi:short-subunit dehydrogenase